ncbi:MAG: magnesium chelatase, partial [Muribaculaceae bacterium]|nr:magnesium chelatase [Muribaculaceae bacterium]
QMTPSLLHQYAEPDAEGMAQLRQAITSMNMSARAYDRILKVARTIADLEGSVTVRQHHIMEAIGYRNLDRSNYFSL